MLLTILYFLLALGVLVTFHEFGHFYIARRCGVKVIRFSVGFGKPLLSWRDSLGTEYTLAAIPLGGYVKMLDEREGEVAPNELSSAFSQKTVWQRMAIVIAGPVANFILAIILYFILALAGSTGIAPVVGDLPADGIAATAGLKAGDEILSVDGKSVVTWNSVFSQLLNRIGDSGDIELQVMPYSSAGNGVLRTVKLPISRWLHDDDEPHIFKELGIVQFMPDAEMVIAQVIADSAAEAAGLQSGDRIIRVEGKEIPSWRAWVDYVRERPNVDINIQVERDSRVLAMSLTPRAIENDDGIIIGQVGVSAALSWPEGMLRTIDYSPIEAVGEGFRQTWERASFILVFIKKLLVADVSTKNLSGTFTIAQVAGDSAKAGIITYLGFIAFLSVSLGVFNLLPIPVLDGGHLLYYVIEWAKGSPVSEKIQMVGYQVGLFFVLGIMVVAHVNDLLRIFT